MALDLTKPVSSNSFLQEIYNKIFGVSDTRLEVASFPQSPDLTDTTSSTVIYEGYKSGTSYHICKIDLSTAIISRKYATGAWADRSTLTYL